MSSFDPASTQVRQTAADSSKHVNYVLGLVLGVDDFTQEFTYLSERDRWLVRDLLGSGTASGLSLSRRAGERGPEVTVSPGVAVSPRGQLIRVTVAQSASLDDWLAAHQAQVSERMEASPNTPLALHVVLRYREVLTDSVPIPGELTRTEDQLMAPSRVQDDSQLELLLDPPALTEEDALRDFARWLRAHLQPVNTEGTSLANFLQGLRQAVVTSVPPNAPPDYLNDSAPPIPVPAGLVSQYLRAAFRLWITELRPLWRTVTSQATRDAVLLATLRLPLSRSPGGGPWRVSSLDGIVIDEESRPLLVPLRMVQEWNLATALAAASSGGGGPAPNPSLPRITSISPSSSAVDSEIRISVENFDARAEGHTIKIDGIPLTPSPESTPSTLFVVIPSSLPGGVPPPGTSRAVPVTVQTPAGTASATLQVSPPLDISLPVIRSITPPEAARGRTLQIQTNILRAQLQYPFPYQNVWFSFSDPVIPAQEQLIWAPGMSPHIFDDNGVLTLNLPAAFEGLDAVHTPLRTRMRLITQGFTSGIVRVSPAFDYTVHYGL